MKNIHQNNILYLNSRERYAGVGVPSQKINNLRQINNENFICCCVLSEAGPIKDNTLSFIYLTSKDTCTFPCGESNCAVECPLHCPTISIGYIKKCKHFCVFDYIGYTMTSICYACTAWLTV